jgi:hypothetical protein
MRRMPEVTVPDQPGQPVLDEIIAAAAATV